MCQLVQVLMTLLQKKKIEGMIHLFRVCWDAAYDWLQEERETEQNPSPHCHWLVSRLSHTVQLHIAPYARSSTLNLYHKLCFTSAKPQLWLNHTPAQSKARENCSSKPVSHSGLIWSTLYCGIQLLYWSTCWYSVIHLGVFSSWGRKFPLDLF